MNEKIKKKYPTFSFNLESFLQNLPAKKRALYLRGYNKALADHKIDGTMTAMVK